jgi:hypothetical protein
MRNLDRQFWLLRHSFTIVAISRDDPWKDPSSNIDWYTPAFQPRKTEAAVEILSLTH